MEKQDSKYSIVKQAFPSEVISIVGDIFAGIVLTLLILPFKSFFILIIIIPPLLSLRGNLSGPYIARTSRDLIIGEFNKRSFLENLLATLFLSIVTALLIGFLCTFLIYMIFGALILSIQVIFGIPIYSILLALGISIPLSTLLNIIAFKFGLDPNSVVNTIMTAVDDFLTVLSFYIVIIALGVQ